MVKIGVYRHTLGIEDIDSLVNKFVETLVDTNRSYSFFVDWEKVKSNARKYKIEINILNSLLGTKDFENELKEILKRYPEVTPVFPILIAVRDLRLKIIEDFSATDVNILSLILIQKKYYLMTK